MRASSWAGHSIKCRASLGARQEIADCRSDLITMRLEGEVAGVEEAHVSVWNVTLERLGARRQEKRVVLAPSCQKRRLVLAKIGLEFGIQRDVALVVAEKVELHFISARSCEIEVVERIPVWRNRGRVGDAVGVLPDRCLGRKKGAEGCAVCFGRVLPVCADRSPAVTETLLVGVAVLRNDGCYPLRMANGEPEACWRAVVEDVHRKLIEAYDFGEALDHAGNVVECVSEFFSRRHVGLPEPRKVRRNHKKSVGEQRDQITEHVARARETVQQQQLRCFGWPRFTIEDLETVDVGLEISDRHHENPTFGAIPLLLTSRPCTAPVNPTPPSSRRWLAQSHPANPPEGNAPPRPSPRPVLVTCGRSRDSRRRRRANRARPSRTAWARRSSPASLRRRQRLQPRRRAR